MKKLILTGLITMSCNFAQASMDEYFKCQSAYNLVIQEVNHYKQYHRQMLQGLITKEQELKYVKYEENQTHWLELYHTKVQECIKEGYDYDLNQFN